MKKPTDLDLHCLQNRIYPGSAGQGLTLSGQIQQKKKKSFFLIFSEKIGIDILKVCMKCQCLFSLKNKKNFQNVNR